MGREMIVADFAASAASVVTLGHGVSKSSSERVEQRLSTLSTPENMTDPGTQRAPLIAAQVSSLKDLLYNPEEGHSSEPNWAQLGTVDGHNMGIYLKNALQVSRGFLDPSKPISMSLLKVVDSCTPVCRLSSVFKTCGPHSSLTDRSQVLDDLIVTTRSAQIDDLLSRIPNHRTIIDKADTEIQHLCQIAAFAAQVPGTTASGLANPSTPQLSGKASEVAIKSAQYRIELTRANLASSRDSFYNVSQLRQQQQSEITKTILEMTQLDLANISVRGQSSLEAPSCSWFSNAS